MTVRAVVVDLGNVLVRWDARAAFAGAYTDRQVDEFLDTVDFPRLNLAQDAGRPWAQARMEVAATYPEQVSMLDHYVRNFAASLPGPVPGSAEVVDELRAADIPVYGLTNWSAETFHHAAPAAPVVARLDGVVVSGRVGLAKPDPRIFQLVLDRYRLDPADTVFTDDAPRNVEGAAAVGMDAVLFTDAPALRAALVARGALPPLPTA